MTGLMCWWCVGSFGAKLQNSIFLTCLYRAIWLYGWELGMKLFEEAKAVGKIVEKVGTLI